MRGLRQGCHGVAACRRGDDAVSNANNLRIAVSRPAPRNNAQVLSKIAWLRQRLCCFHPQVMYRVTLPIPNA